MTLQFVAEVAGRDTYRLGEGPVWDRVRNRLLWVDILAGRVFAGSLDGPRITPTSSWDYDSTVGAVAVTEDGRLLVAARHSVLLDGAFVTRVLPADSPRRLNDGAVDPAGRFLVGSLTMHGEPDGHEILTRLDGTILDADLSLSNGLAWDPSGTRLYSIDSLPGRVWVRDYDAVSGRAGPRELLFQVTDGLPDGMCVDADGNLWIAIYGGGRVECRTPAGDLLATVAVGVPSPTSVAFAGPDLGTLVITSVGPLFTARVGVTGAPVPYFRQ